MARLYIKGNRDPVEITQEQALAIQKAMADSVSTIGIGDITIRTSEIKMVEGDGQSIKQGYDLEDDKRVIKDFETELGDKDFKQYCYNKGYLIKNSKYPERAVNYNTLAQYNDIREKNKALEKLHQRRLYAQKQEHLDNLGKEECLKKEGLDRCKFCYPFTIKEIVAQIKSGFPEMPKVEVIENFESEQMNLNELPF